MTIGWVSNAIETKRRGGCLVFLWYCGPFRTWGTRLSSIITRYTGKYSWWKQCRGGDHGMSYADLQVYMMLYFDVCFGWFCWNPCELFGFSCGEDSCSSFLFGFCSYYEQIQKAWCRYWVVWYAVGGCISLGGNVHLLWAVFILTSKFFMVTNVWSVVLFVAPLRFSNVSLWIKI